ncbi:hypothetical protein AVEN_215534-1 [Araneus ventricosus]|uniref:Uncharacterized protein n=1 Tax=Araneus ventricosus TaxID=182803 RepID=A0A4Y2BFP1_ARAVE|nr:hypothetical protein AVEN_215534-1 [Araneus ventricosus]
MPAVIVVFEEESESPLSLIEELGRSSILRSLYSNGLRNQRVNVSAFPLQCPRIQSTILHFIFLKRTDIEDSVEKIKVDSQTEAIKDAVNDDADKFFNQNFSFEVLKKV